MDEFGLILPLTFFFSLFFLIFVCILEGKCLGEEGFNFHD